MLMLLLCFFTSVAVILAVPESVKVSQVAALADITAAR